jgi:folylpolyglutamate synthase
MNERIRINFEPLSNDLFTRYFFEVCEAVLPDVNGPGPRALQLLALTSFHTFIKERVDVAIYETHHGGEFDATNVIQRPAVTVITPIGIDHANQLGPGVDNIAWHKAGIMKPGALAYSAPQIDEVTNVLKRRAEEKGVRLEFVEMDKDLPGSSQWTDAQLLNCSLARHVSTAFLQQQAKVLEQDDVSAAISQFSWPGRFQTLYKDNITWFLDGAHNELSVKVVADWFSRSSIRKTEGYVNQPLCASWVLISITTATTFHAS